MNGKNNMVSIFMMTYNHERFITQALDSILMQKVNFKYNIIIGDDCSTDNTRDILLSYKSKFPEIIKLLLHESNIGAQQNQVEVFKNCDGKYIAMLEGDDYWTDPLKLQKQVDFLEKNPIYTICFHDVKVISDNENTDIEMHEISNHDNKTDFTFDELLRKGNIMHTPSVVFKRPQVQIPVFNSVTGDYFLHLHNAYYGKIKRIKEEMACYRVHRGGVFSNRKRWPSAKKIDFLKKQINAYIQFLREYKISKKHTVIIKERLYFLYNNLRLLQISYSQFSEAKHTAYKQLKVIYSVKTLINFKANVSLFMTLILPRVISKHSNTEGMELNYSQKLHDKT